MEDELRAGLRESCGRKALERDLDRIRSWKAEEQLRFLNLLQAKDRRTLPEPGAGSRKGGVFFRDQRPRRPASTFRPKWWRSARARASRRVMDLADLDFPPDTFDAVYAPNCLLHVPDRELPGVLRGARSVLKPGGLFYLGAYGGIDHEGVWEDDPYDPKRYLSFRTDERLREIVAGTFEVHTFRRIALDGRRNRRHDGLHDGLYF